MQGDFCEQETIVTHSVTPVVISLIRTRGQLLDFCNWVVGGCWRLRANMSDAETICTISAVAYIQNTGIEVTEDVQKLVKECIVQNLLRYYNTSGRTLIVPTESAHVRRRYENETLS